MKIVAACTAFLKIFKVMRIRYAYQVTVTVDNSVLKRAYADSGTEVALYVALS